MPSRRRRAKRYSLQNNDHETILRKIQSAKDELLASKFYEDTFHQFRLCIDRIEVDKVDRIVCLGLGNFATCPNSRYQLALLLLIKENGDIPIASLYDPVFSEQECKALTNLNLELFLKNENGFTELDNEGVLIFLPHVEFFLINNLLWANWGHKLQKFVILCNSFHEYNENYEGSAKDTDCILRLSHYVEEFPLSNNFRYTDIFNNLSYHVLPEMNTKVTDDKFWIQPVKPPQTEIVDKNDISFLIP